MTNKDTLTCMKVLLDDLEKNDSAKAPVSEIVEDQVCLLCPVCRTLVQSYDNFCRGCGQKLREVKHHD